MSTGIVVLLVIIGVIAGFAIGFFAEKKYLENYLKKNPPFNEQMLKTMMLQMGQKPSQRKINQMMTSMKASYAKENSKKKR